MEASAKGLLICDMLMGEGEWLSEFVVGGKGAIGWVLDSAQPPRRSRAITSFCISLVPS